MAEPSGCGQDLGFILSMMGTHGRVLRWRLCLWSACIRFTFSRAPAGCCVGNLEGQSTMRGKHQEERGAQGLAHVVMMEVEKERDFSCILEAKLTGFERVSKEQRNQG